MMENECRKDKQYKKHTCLSIAGSDSSGGAGIQADIKTMTMNGVYAMSAITALTAQNTTGVQGICEISSEFIKLQIDSVFEDICPDAVKIGMVMSSKLIEVIADRLIFYRAKRIVIDPVMIASSGARLINEDAVDALMRRLFPLATVITPNIPEAKTICGGKKIETAEDMRSAATAIGKKFSCAVLLKGGHMMTDNADDLLYLHDSGRYVWFRGKRIHNPNTHGTGCTLSSAIASNLAKGFNICEAVGRAKEYVSGALRAMLDLGGGCGPIEHNFALKGYFSEEKSNI